ANALGMKIFPSVATNSGGSVFYQSEPITAQFTAELHFAKGDNNEHQTNLRLQLTDDAFLGRLNAVYTGMNGNPGYPNPPIDMKAFKADIDSYSALITAALDGGKKAISEKRKKR